MAVKPTYSELEHKVLELEQKTTECIRIETDMKTSHEERIQFERQLAELSALFVNIPADEIDQKVEDMLRQMGEILGLERTDIAQINEDRGQLQFTHSWTAKGVGSIAGRFAYEDFPALTQLVTSKDEYILFTSPDDLPGESPKDVESIKKVGVESGLIIPYFSDNKFVCVVAFGTHSSFQMDWSEGLIQRLTLLGEVISNALIRKETDLKLRNAFKKIQTLQKQLQKENIFLRKEIEFIQPQAEIIGESDDIKEVLNKIKQVAPTDSGVLITGETGTGKELIARAIHKTSLRKHRAMITVNCAALPSSLVEGELFGREKGAYTGAMTKQAGRFEIADGSTIFLDEIGEVPLELQVKLLRVLEEGQFERLGSSKTIHTNMRVIAATNQDLEKRIKDGRFRQDLYYRLNVFPIHISPLRQRPADIIPLTWAFIKEFSETMGRRIDMISKDGLEAIQHYSWPGNVRELKNVIERAVIAGTGKILQVVLQDNVNSKPLLNLEALERKHILTVLENTKWRIRGHNGAAEILGLKPTTLYSRMKKLGIKRPK
jgi:transcriptional regulator with GAF, ATPase, and Fis domain